MMDGNSNTSMGDQPPVIVVATPTATTTSTSTETTPPSDTAAATLSSSEAAYYVGPAQLAQFQQQQPDMTQSQPQSVQQHGIPLIIGDVEFSQDQAVSLVKLPGPFKIHFLVVLSLCAFALLMWIFMGIGFGWFPWFIFPTGLGVMSLSTHFYIFIRPREWLQLHVVFFLTMNCTLFVSWEASETYSVFFVYGLFLLSELLGIHIILLKFKRPDKLWLFYLHCLTYVNLSLILFFAYLDTRDANDFPWWVIPYFFLTCLVVLHYCIAYKFSYFKLHVYMFSSCQVEIFSIWVVCGTDIFPWFSAALLVWGVLLFVHYYVLFVRGKGAQPTAPVAEQQQPGFDPSAVPPVTEASYGGQPAYVVQPAQPVYVIAGDSQPMYPPIDPNTH